jgi:hypothetical protein
MSSLPAAAQGVDIQIGKHGIRPVVRDDAMGGAAREMTSCGAR